MPNQSTYLLAKSFPPTRIYRKTNNKQKGEKKITCKSIRSHQSCFRFRKWCTIHANKKTISKIGQATTTSTTTSREWKKNEDQQRWSKHKKKIRLFILKFCIKSGNVCEKGRKRVSESLVERETATWYLGARIFAQISFENGEKRIVFVFAVSKANILEHLSTIAPT